MLASEEAARDEGRDSLDLVLASCGSRRRRRRARTHNAGGRALELVVGLLDGLGRAGRLVELLLDELARVQDAVGRAEEGSEAVPALWREEDLCAVGLGRRRLCGGHVGDDHGRASRGGRGPAGGKWWVESWAGWTTGGACARGYGSALCLKAVDLAAHSVSQERGGEERAGQREEGAAATADDDRSAPGGRAFSGPGTREPRCCCSLVAIAPTT